MNSPQYDLSPSNEAFENAFKAGKISAHENWMYMYSDQHHDYFKNRDTKQYIKCLKESKE